MVGNKLDQRFKQDGGHINVSVKFMQSFFASQSPHVVHVTVHQKLETFLQVFIRESAIDFDVNHIVDGKIDH